MKDLFARHPQELPMHAMAIVEKLSPRITDTDRTVRQTFVLLLKTTILPGLPQVFFIPLNLVLLSGVEVKEVNEFGGGTKVENCQLSSI